MTQTKLLGIIIALLVTVSSCKKESVETDCSSGKFIVFEDDCVPYPPPPPFIIQWPISIPDETIYMTGDVSPTNENEFCIMQSLGLYSKRILIYNRETNEVDILLDGYFNETLWWMANDWIVYFDFNSGTLRRIKRDGSQIQDIFPESGIRPKRNYDHTQLLCHFESATYIIEGTDIVDSIPNSFEIDGDWDHPEGKYLFADYNQIGIHNSLYAEPIIFDIDTDLSIDGIKWCDNYSRIIWHTQEGWFKTNPNTGETHKIRENCEAKSFRVRAHVGEDLLVRQLYRMPYDGDTLLTTAQMGLFKCDGSQIELFDIPQ